MTTPSVSSKAVTMTIAAGRKMAGPIGLISILTSSGFYTACTDISLNFNHTGVHKPET